ncbi:MAG: aminotransferase class I/II-fold pyridoxal phosphate-dependent enzyme [Rhodopseudomonas sp.]|nr:aminotransferase class I/II-fold pyridoxal phosphate-dependent enzyme [Rhodopseudomonas sp.]
MQIPVLLDRSRREPLINQLCDQLREAIRQTRLAAGTRLPSSRQLSEQLAVSRNTVVRAYDSLIVEGYVESRPGSGIFVSDRPPAIKPSFDTDTSDIDFTTSASAMPIPTIALRAPTVGHLTPGRLSFDFFPGRPSAAQFPIKTWRRILHRNLAQGGGTGLTHYGDPAGLPLLRSAIASHLATSRGIAADPSRIVIVSGIQEGIGIAARLFLNADTLTAIEDPCHQGVAYAFEATGTRMAHIAVDNEGLIPDDLPRRQTALLYVTPSHQFPTGHTLSLTRRREIVRWARRNGCYILEDDRDSDFRYEGSPLPAIAAAAPDCTIYLGTFSRSLGAGLRLGYMVVPRQLAELTAHAKALLNSGNPWLEQSALAEMMRNNSYDAHLLRIRATYRQNRDRLLVALRRNFGDVIVTGEHGGLHLVWHLPPGVPNAAVVEAIARRARIGVYSLASGGAYAAKPSNLVQRGLMLGYAALNAKQIEQGIARLSDAIDDSIDDPGADVSALFARLSPAITAGTSGASPVHLDSKLRRQPALAAIRRPRASSASNPSRGHARAAGRPMATVSRLYRYPIKGLSAQPLSCVALEPDKPFPHDREYALARPGAPIDSRDPKWAKKGLFVMLMLDEGLARVTTKLDVDSHHMTVTQGNRQIAQANLTDEAERAEFEHAVWKLVPTLPAPPTLVHSSGGHFMDKPDNVISLINLATVRSLEQQWGVAIDPLRFRANIYIDGAKPWEEFDWVGGDISIGGVDFAVDRKNGRCGATNVNPQTGRRDLDIPASLRAMYGHKNLGVYLIAKNAGQIAVDDALTTPNVKSAVVAPVLPEIAMPVPARSFICRGCYFIYEEAKGLPQQAIAPGTAIANIPDAWRCPDCGTDKTTFRPYAESETTV